jgi:hypothetical protein
VESQTSSRHLVTCMRRGGEWTASALAATSVRDLSAGFTFIVWVKQLVPVRKLEKPRGSSEVLVVGGAGEGPALVSAQLYQ